MIEKGDVMQSVSFQNVNLHLVESSDHMFLLSSHDVASGYGISEKTLRDHKTRQSDELIEGKHFIIDRSYRNTPKTYWTKRGIVRLGFFIKSERAKAFRDWAEDYVIDGQMPNAEYQRIIMLQNEQIVQMDREINRLKGILIKLHDGFHAQLEKATNIFQLIGNTKKDGGNLNTETIAGHRYWGIVKK